MTNTTGHNGSDIAINDYVAIVFDNGSQSTVLGRVTDIVTDNLGSIRVIVDAKNGVRASRLVRTNVR